MAKKLKVYIGEKKHKRKIDTDLIIKCTSQSTLLEIIDRLRDLDKPYKVIALGLMKENSDKFDVLNAIFTAKSWLQLAEKQLLVLKSSKHRLMSNLGWKQGRLSA